MAEKWEIENAGRGLDGLSELVFEGQCYEYKLEREYSNLHWDIITNREQVVSLVAKDIKNKWNKSEILLIRWQECL